MKKVLKWIVLGIVALIVIAVLVLFFAGGQVIKVAVEQGGQFALQVPVHLKGASLGLLSGKVELREFLVENPEGYKTPSAIEVKRIYVEAPFTKMLGEKPRIEAIIVEAPVITLEQGLGKSNLGDLMKNAQSLQGEEKAEEEAPKEEKKEGKKMTIGKLRIEGARVNLSTTVSMGQSAPILIAPIELNELGAEDDEGVTLADTIAISLREIVQAAVKQGGNLMPKGLGKSLNASVASFDEASKKLVGSIGDATSGLSDATKKATGDLQEKTKGLLGGGKKAPKGEKKGLFGGLKKKPAEE